MEEAPQSGNGEEGEGSSLDGEGREVERGSWRGWATWRGGGGAIG